MKRMNMLSRVVPASGPLFVLLASVLAVPACGGGSPPPASTAASAPASAGSAPAAASAPLPPGSVRRSSIRKALAAGPAVFLQRVELDDQPVFVGGKFHGFRIAALRGEPSFWEGVDLQPGDVVRLVNGRSIERPQDAFDAFHGLEVAREIRIDYERVGVPRTLVFNVVEDEPAAPAKPAVSPAKPAEKKR